MVKVLIVHDDCSNSMQCHIVSVKENSTFPKFAEAHAVASFECSDLFMHATNI